MRACNCEQAQELRRQIVELKERQDKLVSQCVRSSEMFLEIERTDKIRIRELEQSPSAKKAVT